MFVNLWAAEIGQQMTYARSVSSGLSSGEGLIWEVRERSTSTMPVRTTSAG